MLFDTGMGAVGSPLAEVFGIQGRLEDVFRAAGVDAEDIEIVVLSHLHPDHVGGNVRRDAGDVGPVFPRAR